MIQVLKNPCDNIFYNMIASAQKEINLCAPFVKKDIIEEILCIKKSEVKLSLITSSNVGAFCSKGSDIEAIKLLFKHGVEVYNYQNLHAKIYIFDKLKAMITSSNLTYSGLVKNYEYGVLLEEKSIIKSIVNDYKKNDIRFRFMR